MFFAVFFTVSYSIRARGRARSIIYRRKCGEKRVPKGVWKDLSPKGYPTPCS